MRIIRNNIFETNSSSVHAICISKDENTYSIPDYVYFARKDFSLKDANRLEIHSKEDRASYLYETILDSDTFEGTFHLERLKFMLENNKIKYEFQTVEKFGFYDNRYGYDYFIEKAIYRSNEDFLKYLFSDSAYIIIASDADYFTPEELAATLNSGIFDIIYK